MLNLSQKMLFLKILKRIQYRSLSISIKLDENIDDKS